MDYRVYDNWKVKSEYLNSQKMLADIYNSGGTEPLGCQSSEEVFPRSIFESYEEESSEQVLFKSITDLDSDSDSSSSSSSDSEDQDEIESVLEDHAKIIWKSLTETIEKIDDVLVVDRAFMHGDIVGYVSNPSGQTGTVVNVELLVDLKAPGGEMIKNLDSKILSGVCPFVIGDYVICGHWLGRVDGVFHDVTILLDNDKVCKIKRADRGCLIPISQNFLEDERCPYHPGQRVHGSSCIAFKNAEWIYGSWDADQTEGTVVNVEVESVSVSWIVEVVPVVGSQSQAPAIEQDPKYLTLLSCFSHANWRLGDWCLLSTETKFPTESDAPESEQSERNPIGHGKINQSLLVTKTKTRVDIVWQDGSQSCNVDSRTLFAVDSIGNHDFWPEQYVVEKGQDEDGCAPEAKRVGVVKNVDSKERIVQVKWFKKCTADAREFDKEEIVSVYELAEHPDYNFSIGDIVICISSAEGKSIVEHEINHNDTLCKMGLSKDESGYAERDLRTSYSGKDGNFVEQTALSSVGTVKGLKDGEIEVAWADGTVSKVGPDMVVVVARDEYEDADSSHSESENGIDVDKDDVISWGTIGSDEILIDENVEQLQEASFCQNASGILINENESHVAENGNQNDGRALSFSQTAFSFVTRLARGFFGAPDSQIVTEASGISNNAELNCYEREAQEHHGPSINEDKALINKPHFELTECASVHSLNPVITLNSLAVPRGTEPILYESVHRNGDDRAPMQDLNASMIHVAEAASSSEELKKLPKVSSLSSTEISPPEWVKHFDCVTDAADHFFFNKKNQSSTSRQWIRKVQREWDILEKNLPEGIFVKVYEDRIDLLRAVIIGAAGTPYQDGLFFFDIHLPPEYPRVPPLAHYHSCGLRLNPNLYENGKICLSLLNTWAGKGNEVWDPASSSVLQVLVSLQGLVLNEKPYFNEAGYDKHIGKAEGEKNSLAYNENAFLLSCKSMLYLLRRPPKRFELFVKEHFRKRGCYIIQACNAYMMGAQVGCLSEAATIRSERGESICSSSNGFKIMLGKLLPKLIAAFHDIDSDSEEQGLTV